MLWAEIANSKIIDKFKVDDDVKINSKLLEKIILSGTINKKAYINARKCSFQRYYPTFQNRFQRH